MLIDESRDRSGKPSLCIVCIQGEENFLLAQEIFRQAEVSSDVAAIRKDETTLHFAYESIGGRQSVVTHMRRMPVSAYIAVCEDPVSDEKRYDLMYQVLLPRLLKPLISKFNSRCQGSVEYELLFENITEKHENDRSYFLGKVDSLDFGAIVSVNVVTKKSEPLLWLPDYFLGFLGQFFGCGDSTWARDSLHLLQDKIGLIQVSRGENVLYVRRGHEISDFLSHGTSC